MRVKALTISAVAAAALASGHHLPQALACAALSERGAVTIRGEEALIVWDDTTKTEHFIRRAFFKDAPADFGFLVPTPGKPELAEVPSAVFDRLYDLYREPPSRAPLFSRGVKSTSAVEPPSNGVRVVEEKQVAGLDATVLLASDATALSAWLKAHKYPSSPALEIWLAPYVKKGAYVTAFKLAGGTAAMASKSVRMSFRADAPLFPYSEPPGDGQPRPFRLSIVAPTRMDGSLGDKAWKADVGYAAAMGEGEVRALLDGVTPRGAQHAGWITTFDEPRSIRGKDDLILKPAKNGRVAPHLTTKIEP
jgi:hypothetical protein